jgi:hypothetical protein
MASELKHLIWDTCVFGRYLTGEPADFVDDIEAFIADVRRGRKTVYYSCAKIARAAQARASLSHVRSVFYRLTTLS